MKKCKVKTCNNKVRAKGYCMAHYAQLRNHGRILTRTPYTPNKIIEYKTYYEIVLYNRAQKEVGRTKIDKEDLSKVKAYKWRLRKDRAASKNKGLSQILLGDKRGFDIDHINHDPLDNRRQNLRHCSRSQNQMNQQRQRGIHFYKRNKKWLAYIGINKIRISLGYFKTFAEALKVRQTAEKIYYEEYAPNLKAHFRSSISKA